MKLTSHRRRLAVAAAALLAAGAGIGAGPAAAAPQVDLASHQAIYKLSMASARNGSPVVGVVGRMQLAFNDACDGWTVEQKFQLQFTYAEGEDMEMQTNYATWESKDGKRFRFNTRKMTNGKADEDLSGDARLDGAAGGSVRYKAPKETEMKLPAGTIFPTAHTLLLVQQARAGEHFFARPLFDGSDAEGSTVVTAVIGRAAPVAPAKDQPAELKRDQGWPVHLAFYGSDPAAAEPEYENVQTQLDNGVVQSMVIDYGTFKVNAVLESLKVIPKNPC
jgi:hypothetical protein